MHTHIDIIFSDSMSSIDALSGFQLQLDLVQKTIIKDYTTIKDYTALTNSGTKNCPVLDPETCQHPR